MFGDHDSAAGARAARGAAFAAARPTAPIGETSGTDRRRPPCSSPNHTARRDVGIARPAAVPAPTRSRLNVGSITSVLVAAVTVFAVAGFMLITGDADQESAKVEHRQVVETLVSSAKPVPVELPPAQEPPAPPPVVQELHLPRPCGQDRRSGSRSPQDAMECTAAGCAAPPLNPGFDDAAVKAIQDWWLAQPPRRRRRSGAAPFQPFNPFAPPA